MGKPKVFIIGSIGPGLRRLAEAIADASYSMEAFRDAVEAANVVIRKEEKERRKALREAFIDLRESVDCGWPDFREDFLILRNYGPDEPLWRPQPRIRPFRIRPSKMYIRPRLMDSRAGKKGRTIRKRLGK